jgi:hypothetical protein
VDQPARTVFHACAGNFTCQALLRRTVKAFHHFPLE